MEDDKYMYEAMLRMSKLVDIMYDAYEKRIEEEEKEISKNDALSTSSSAYAFCHCLHHLLITPMRISTSVFKKRMLN